MPLAVIHGAGNQADGAVRLELNGAHFLAGGRRCLQITGQPAAPQFTLGFAGRLPRFEAMPVGGIEAFVQHRREITAVIDKA